MYPVQVAVNAPLRISRLGRRKNGHAYGTGERKHPLKQQLLEDSVQLQQSAALEQENVRLRDLMQAGTHVSGHVAVATLLAVDMDPFRHVIVIDKGAHDNVYEGQTLLDAHGIIGQVIRVEPVSSEAALITDPSQAIQVQVNRTGLRTLVIGSADVDTLSLPYLPNNADVRPGDLLVSSGLGGRYPPGYPVATVTTVHRDPAEPFATVVARPMADLDHGHNILLYFPVEAPPPMPKPESGAAKKTTRKRP